MKGDTNVDKYKYEEVIKALDEYFGTHLFPPRRQLSGRYKYNGGTIAQAGIALHASGCEYPISPLKGPIYNADDSYPHKESGSGTARQSGLCGTG